MIRDLRLAAVLPVLPRCERARAGAARFYPRSISTI